MKTLRSKGKVLVMGAVGAVALAGVAAGVAQVTPAAHADGPQRWTVTVTNINRGQPMAPPIVYTHRAGHTLFRAGEALNLSSATGAGLALLAEEGSPAGLATALASDANVLDVEHGSDIIRSALIDATGAGLGTSRSFTVDGDLQGGYRFLTFAAMLGLTNDTFASITVPLPLLVGNTTEYYATSWDAGTEGNDQIHVAGAGTALHTPAGEGRVSVSTGAHGPVAIPSGPTFAEDVIDWSNPAALITITRVR